MYRTKFQTLYHKKLYILFIIYTFFFLFVLTDANANSLFPKIIAHRGGKHNFPENTVYAIEESLKLGSDGIEMDLQVTKDGKVVLYHPNELEKWTNGKGEIKNLNYEQITTLNAAYNFQDSLSNELIFRKSPLIVPTLEEVLEILPKEIIIILDLKSLPADELIDAIIPIIDSYDAWENVIFYSTNQEHLEYLKLKRSRAIIFESREETRFRLLNFKLNHKCSTLPTEEWIGFELNREFRIIENLTLTSGLTDLSINMWDKEIIKCIYNMQKTSKIILFGINTKEDYLKAIALGAYAVFTDDPKLLISVRNTLKANPH